MITQTQQALDAAIRSVLIPELPTGFSYGGCTVEWTQALGSYAQGELRSTHRRKLVIGYVPSCNERKEVLLIHVENMEGDTFSVPEFAKHTDTSAEKLCLDITQYEGSLSDRIESTLRANVLVLTGSLANVIAGQEWVHVPMDWGDYK